MSVSGTTTTAHRLPDPVGNWAKLFHHSSQPVFLLSCRGRVRYVNPAWVNLTKLTEEEMLGKVCRARSKETPDSAQRLANYLLPPAEVWEGRAVTVRRPIPPKRFGPPWWEIQYLPIQDAERGPHILGTITVHGEAELPTGGKGLSEGLTALREQTAASYSFEMLAGEHGETERLMGQARLAALHRHPVWIRGERGTGKETLARIIHFQGVTRERCFLGIDCLGLQPYLIRSMLFGSGGIAESSRLGTMYLKDPSGMPPDLQSELLEWYDEHPNPPRMILGHRTPEPGTKSIGFLPDFTARFQLFEMELPPLRILMERGELSRIVARCLRREIAGPHLPDIDPSAWSVFQEYPWPGNYHELRSTLHDVVKASAGKRIEAVHFPRALLEHVRGRTAAATPVRPTSRKVLTLEKVLEEVERKMIASALRRAKGNRADAAELLGISRSRLARRLEVLKME